jgi:hypothetical protein
MASHRIKEKDARNTEVLGDMNLQCTFISWQMNIEDKAETQSTFKKSESVNSSLECTYFTNAFFAIFLPLLTDLPNSVVSCYTTDKV